MRLNNFLFALLIAMILISFINSFVVFFKISEFREKFTGKALTNYGFVNITINTLISLTLLRDTINWSNGAVDSGKFNATLTTHGDFNGTVNRGNWTNNTDKARAIIVQNVGTLNCSLYVRTNKNAHDFFNSSSNSNEEYKINVSNKDEGSCSGGAALGQWMDVNKTDAGTKYCGQFDFSSNHNEIYLDFLITIPFDSRNTGNQSDIITILGDVAG